MMNGQQHIYAGISIETAAESVSRVAIALRDDTYLLDFMEHIFSTPARSSTTHRHIVTELKKYSDGHSEKILGVALSRSLHERMPALCPHLWAELDIVPIILDEESDTDATAGVMTRVHFQKKPIDEQAESLARKCIR